MENFSAAVQRSCHRLVCFSKQTPPGLNGHRNCDIVDVELLVGVKGEESPWEGSARGPLVHPCLGSATLLWCHSLWDCENEVRPRAHPPAEFQLEEAQLSPSQWYKVEWKLNNGRVQFQRHVLSSAAHKPCPGSWSSSFPGIALLSWMHFNDLGLAEHPAGFAVWYKRRRKALCGSVVSWCDEVD